MAISASTSGYDSIILSGPGKSLFENGKVAAGTSTWNQGDIMCFDTSTHVIRAVAATGDAVTLIGVADNSVVSGKLLGPYTGLTATNAAEVGPGFAGPKYGVVANPILNTGDAFAIGAKVYLIDALSCQTVSSTDPGDHNYIGIYQGPAVTSAAAGQKGPVLIGARYPSATATGLVF